MKKNVSIEELNGKTVIKGKGLTIEVNEHGDVTIDTSNSISFRGATFKKIDGLSSSIVNAVLTHLNEK